MSLVDEKYAANLAAQATADEAKTTLENIFDSLGSLTEEERNIRQESIRKIDLKLAEELIEIDPAEWGQNISIRQSDPVAQIAYGFCRMGGAITFFRSDRSDSEPGEFLHVFVSLASHRIEEVTDLYLDAQKVAFNNDLDGGGKRRFGWAVDSWENLVFCSAVSRGDDDQPANPDLVGQSNVLFSGQWTDSHRQRGVAGIYLILKYDGTKFISGPPEISVEAKWRSDIYDPRNDSIGYSSNAALCLVNYMTDSRNGPGLSLEDFDLANISEAADICDEEVSLSSGGTEKRYSCDGAFQISSSNNHEQVIESMRRAMAGHLARSGGKIYLYPGSWREPTVFFTEKDLRSDFRISTRPTPSAIYNSVKGKYRSPLTGWELSDYPAVLNSLYEEEDGQRIYKELDLPFTTSPTRAQRIAKILLEEGRQWQEIEAEFSIAAMQLKGGENCGLSLERFGIDKKPYKVLGYDFSLVKGSEGVSTKVKLLLRETAAGVFDWNNGEETTVDLAPNTALPDPTSVESVSGMSLDSGSNTLYIRSDGTVFTRLEVSWTPTNDPFVLTGGFYEIQYRLSEDVAPWEIAGLYPGTTSNAYLLDVEDGKNYDVRIRARTVSGVSDWFTIANFLVQGKLEPPSNVTGFSAEATARGILLSWSPVDDLDLLDYEIRVGSDWSSGEMIYRAAATSFLWPTQSADIYMFHIRARDTTQNYSFEVTSIDLQISSPGAVQNLNAVAIQNLVRLDWDEPSIVSFPVGKYRIYKGASLGSASVLGDAAATIKTFHEQVSGEYTYWVTPIDIHGNEGPERSVTISVAAPVNFELLDDQVLDLSAASLLTNAVVENNAIVAPVRTGQSYSDHFTENSWNTPQDQINAGFPVYVQPAETTDAFYEQKIDFGINISSALVTVQDIPDWIDGNGDIELTLSYSSDDTTYTSEVDTHSLLASDFRYVRLSYRISGDDITSILSLPAPRVRLEVRKDRDEGVVYASASDPNGTLVSYNRGFLDVFVESVSVEHSGPNAYFASSTLDGLNPNELRVFLWNSSGARVSGDVRWTVSGVVAD